MSELDRLARLLSLQAAAFSEFQELLGNIQQHPLFDVLFADQAELVKRAQLVHGASERLHTLYSQLTPYIDRNLSALEEQQDILRRLTTRLNQRLPTDPPDTSTAASHDWN